VRRVASGGLILLGLLFSGWELYAFLQWLRQTGGLEPGFRHLLHTLRSDWMALIVVSDHLVIAATVLVAILIDATRLGWPASRRVLFTLAFIGLGSPALLFYLAWRVSESRR
jgi:nicotinamide riboside transporter PnuC